MGRNIEKRIRKISIIVVTLIMLIIICLPMFGPVKIKGRFVPYEYTVHWTYIDISKYTGAESEVEIPSYLWFRPVRELSSQTGRAGFRDLEHVTYIKIPDTVTTLSGAPFKRCWNLEKVVIGSGVNKIPTGSFVNCKKLKSIVLSENIEAIYGDAFAGCELLESVTCYNPETRIDEKVFSSIYASCNFDILTLVSAKDSAVEKYAKEHGIKWQELEE